MTPFVLVAAGALVAEVVTFEGVSAVVVVALLTEVVEFVEVSNSFKS